MFIFNRLPLFIFLGLCLSGCFVTQYYPSYEDISLEPRAQHLVGRCLELKRDAYLFQYPDNKEYALDLPGKSNALPFSAAEYMRDPQNWQNTDTNTKIGKGPADGYMKFKMIDVIPKGTQLHVTKITEKRTLYESFVKVWAQIHDPRYQNLEVDIYFLLKKEYGDVIIPYPSEHELSAMGREKILYPNPGIIEYCEP